MMNIGKCIRLVIGGCPSGVSSNPIKGSHCFLEQKKLPSWLSTG